MQQKAGTVLFRRQLFSIVWMVALLIVTGLVSLPRNGWFGFGRLFVVTVLRETLFLIVGRHRSVRLL